MDATATDYTTSQTASLLQQLSSDELLELSEISAGPVAAVSSRLADWFHACALSEVNRRRFRAEPVPCLPLDAMPTQELANSNCWLTAQAFSAESDGLARFLKFLALQASGELAMAILRKKQ